MGCYIIDLDGTIYKGNAAFPDAPAFIDGLNKKNISYVFFTNCPEKSPQMTMERLQAMSIPALDGSVINSGVLAVEYIVKKSAKKLPVRVNILGSEYMKTYAESLGLTVTRENPDYVLVAFSGSITIDEIQEACFQIRHGARYIATNPDEAIPAEEGLRFHTGAIIDIIKNNVGAEPLVVGKPSDHMREYFLSRFECRAEDICVIGDRLDTDMKFARNCGFCAYLMLSGMTTEEYAKKNKQYFDMSFNSLSELSRCQAAK